jgi:GT2 family glycosyltransferase
LTPAAKKTIAVLLPGENFSRKWVQHWTNIIVTVISQNFDLCPLFGYSSNPHITRAALAAEVRRYLGHIDYLLWIDDDNIVEPAHVLKLLSVLDNSPRVDMVAGWCWIEGNKEEGRPARVSCGSLLPGYSVESFTPAAMSQAAARGSVLEVGWTGFPLVLMRYGTLAKAGLHPFAAILGDHFRYGQMGEDVSFCIKARERGNALICVDPSVKVEHWKGQPLPDPIERTTIDLTNLGARASGHFEKTEKVNL